MKINFNKNYQILIIIKKYLFKRILNNKSFQNKNNN